MSLAYTVVQDIPIFDHNGIRYAFREVPGWPSFHYQWLGLRTAKSEERQVWIENGSADDFSRLIYHLNDTHVLFRFTELEAA